MRVHYVIVKIKEPDEAEPGSHVGLVRSVIHALDVSQGGVISVGDFAVRGDRPSYPWDRYGCDEAARDHSLVTELYDRVGAAARRATTTRVPRRRRPESPIRVRSEE